MHYNSRKYRTLVEWIASNDETAETDLEAVSGFLTVTMLAHCYNLKTTAVAEDVIALRQAGR